MRGYGRKRKAASGMVMLCVALPLAVMLAVLASGSGAAVRHPVPPDNSGVTESPAPAIEVTPELSASPSAEPTQTAAEPPMPTSGAALEPSAGLSAEPTPMPEFPPYSFGTYLEESEPVTDDSYFTGAVFLGDSRTEGLQLYSGLTHGDFFWKRGMTVFRVDSEEWAFEIGGEKLTMIEALGQKRYDSVYIMIGVNELGYPVSSYEQGFGIFIDKVIAAQPDAVIYLQTLPPVNDQAARASHVGSYINNDNINAFNEVIIRMAAEKRVVLLNTAEIFRDEYGQLPADMTSDGCHFKYGKYSLWADYLRRHIMDPARYHYCRETPNKPESAG